MSDEPEQFDDPILKVAVNRLYGQGNAPAAFKERLLGALRDVPAESATPSLKLVSPPETESQLQSKSRTFRLADWMTPFSGLAAAVLLLAFGAFAYFSFSRGAGGKLDRDLLLAMVKTHDGCCGQVNHGDVVADKNIKRVAKSLGRQLQGSVFAPDLAVEQWVFKGAEVCPVAGRQSAHLIFARGGQTMSVFSMPDPPSRRSSNGSIDSQVVADHMVAGFVSKGRVYCMVGYCPKRRLQLDEVAALMEKHRAEMVSDAMASGAGIMESGRLH